MQLSSWLTNINPDNRRKPETSGGRVLSETFDEQVQVSVII